MPTDSRAGRTAAKTARLTVLAPLTEVLEKPTRKAAAASAANPQGVMFQGVIVSMRRPMLGETISAGHRVPARDRRSVGVHDAPASKRTRHCRYRADHTPRKERLHADAADPYPAREPGRSPGRPRLRGRRRL